MARRGKNAAEIAEKTRLLGEKQAERASILAAYGQEAVSTERLGRLVAEIQAKTPQNETLKQRLAAAEKAWQRTQLEAHLSRWLEWQDLQKNSQNALSSQGF